LWNRNGESSFRASRASTAKSFAGARLRMDGRWPRFKHTHPVLGELDLYQWLIFVGQHEGRHKKQIDRTLKSIPT